MLKTLSSYVFLIDGILIGLGAFGHGNAVKNVHAAIDQFPIDPNVSTMLYVVWYFVSGCMLLFGVTILWTWYRVRWGRDTSLFVVSLIGVLYVAVGIGGMIYRHGDSFMGMFIVLGGLLLASGAQLKSGARAVVDSGLSHST